jgi:hypothetical protein
MGEQTSRRALQCEEGAMGIHLLISAILASAVLATSAFAADAPKLPATAKKLSGQEIAALYGGTLKYQNFTQAIPFTGSVTFDLKANTEHGTYSTGASSGEFSGRVRIVGDQWCHQEGTGVEFCVSVYTDGDDIYEVDKYGVVESRNQKQSQP